MAVYVDALREATVPRQRGTRWCHLMADSDAELEKMAAQLGLLRWWKHDDHYDIVSSKRELAVKLGAVEVSSRFLVLLRKGRVQS